MWRGAKSDEWLFTRPLFTKRTAHPSFAFRRSLEGAFRILATSEKRRAKSEKRLIYSSVSAANKRFPFANPCI